MLEIREHEGPDAVGRDREQLALLDEVRREEHGERDLGELAGLEVHRAQLHPESRAVDVAAEHGRERQQQEHDADQRDRVAQAFEVTRPANHEQRQDVGADAEGGPHGLQAGKVPVEAGDEDVAQAVEQAGDREQDAVGLGRQPSRGDVGHRQQPDDHREERGQVGREGGRAPERGERVQHHQIQRALQYSSP